MKNYNELQKLLLSIDGRGYSAYKELRGEYIFGKYILSIDHVQADPFAPPSKARIIISRSEAGFPHKFLDSSCKIRAVSDFLTRAFRNSINNFNYGVNFKKLSEHLTMDNCGQEILERTSILIKQNRIEARFEIKLPAAGRRVLGKSANNIFSDILPKIVDASLLFKNIDHSALKNQIELILDEEYIRGELKERNLVAFIANGSILPRENGISDKPLSQGGVPFQSPEDLEIELILPNHGTVRGMGIPEGITLIVGGGYHGKSTLLKALELGVYNHIPGDGREFVITRSDAVKIRAEDGRRVEKVNISPFINNLPNNKDTIRFTTDNASGSTSQAANVMEALEAGSTLLLIDEDTSATNFMIRDGRMQKLVSKDKEPITPFIDKVRQLYIQHNVSTILIVGGSGDYFDVADHIIMMDEYVPKEVTAFAKNIASTDGYKRERTDENSFGAITARVPLKSSFNHRGKLARIRSKGRHTIMYEKSVIDLSALDQLTDSSQTNCIAVMLNFLSEKIINDQISISQAADKLFEQIENFGLDSISPYTGHPGNLALPRKYELCGAINRYRGLKVKQ
ncbi:ABC-ATPase domain-containing protein [Clostridium sp. Mt-5]|uniref:ABC-ATPase domain-containing protein n=1 Tax=Clostridium moutaii TaxID=3240932 RepID=A0ABV4BUL5_9CLOT